MIETEWLTCTDPKPMLDFLQGKASDRKLRLFACSCVGRGKSDFRCPPKAITAIEKFVDSRQQTAAEELQRLVNPWDFRGRTESGWYRLYLPDIFTAVSAAEIARDLAAEAGRKETTHIAFSAARDTKRKDQCSLLRDIFGNPFRPATLNAGWLTWNEGTIRRISQAIYDDRAFDRLPILADALEDAGCDNADILAHWRNEGPHVRGCWVVELLLGKQ